MINKKINKVFVITILFILFTFTLVLSFHINTERYVYFKPNYDKVDLFYSFSEYEYKLGTPFFSEEDYKLLFYQTGLGKPAVDSIKEEIEKDARKFASASNFTTAFTSADISVAADTSVSASASDDARDGEKVKKKLLASLQSYQEDFFQEPQIQCEQIGIITFEEHVIDKEGKTARLFKVPEMRDGDVLIAKNTHSLGWRHGHAAMIIDAEKGETLEAVLLGQNSSIQSIGKWTSSPSFMLLRPKEGIDGREVAAYALDTMHEIPYGLFVGIPQKFPEVASKTQCAHLVWYPYFKFGYDVDSDGGWLVTPKDIANSEFFEPVQIFGVNPENLWP